MSVLSLGSTPSSRQPAPNEDITATDYVIRAGDRVTMDCFEIRAFSVDVHWAIEQRPRGSESLCVRPRGRDVKAMSVEGQADCRYCNTSMQHIRRQTLDCSEEARIRDEMRSFLLHTVFTVKKVYTSSCGPGCVDVWCARREGAVRLHLPTYALDKWSDDEQCPEGSRTQESSENTTREELSALRVKLEKEREKSDRFRQTLDKLSEKFMKELNEGKLEQTAESALQQETILKQKEELSSLRSLLEAGAVEVSERDTKLKLIEALVRRLKATVNSLNTEVRVLKERKMGKRKMDQQEHGGKRAAEQPEKVEQEKEKLGGEDDDCLVVECVPGVKHKKNETAVFNVKSE